MGVDHPQQVVASSQSDFNQFGHPGLFTSHLRFVPGGWWPCWPVWLVGGLREDEGIIRVNSHSLQLIFHLSLQRGNGFWHISNWLRSVCVVMALIHRHMLLQYDVPGPILWHERLVLEHAYGEFYAIVTPDKDVYVEELSVVNDDLRGLRARPSPGVLPAGIRVHQVYALPAFTAAEMAGFRAEAVAAAQTERAARGVAAAGAPVAGAAAAAPPALPVAGAVAAVDADAALIADQLYWVAAECAGGFRYGEVVNGVGVAAVLGAKAVHVSADGTSLFVECIQGNRLADHMKKPALCDNRIIAIELNGLGKAECSLKEVASRSSETAMQWSPNGALPISSPRVWVWRVTTNVSAPWQKLTVDLGGCKSTIS